MKINTVTTLGLCAAFAVVGCRGAETGDSGAEVGRSQVEAPAAPGGTTPAPGPSVDGVAGDAGTGLENGPASGADGRRPDVAAGGSPAASAPGTRTSGTAGGASAAPATATAPDAAAILRRAEEVYSSVRSMEADFIQNVDVPLLGQSVRSQGKLYHRSPDRFLMQFTQPQGDIVVADGRHLWMYYPSVDARQVMRTTMAAAGGQVDLHREFLSNPTARYHAVLGGVEAVGGRTTDVVVLTPRTRSGYQQVRIWVDREDALVRRFEITEENESVRTLELRNLRRNPTLGDAIFQFTPPAGAQIYEQ